MNKIPYLRIEDTDLDVIDGDRGAHYPNKSELQKSGYSVFLNTGNVTKDGFDFSELEFITEEKDRLLRKGKAKANDIVLTTRGTVGNVGYVFDNVHHKIIRINSGMVIVRTNSKQFLPYYVYIFFRSESFKNQCLKNGSGSAQPQLPISALKNIAIPCWPINKQQHIVSIIQALDAKIELNNRINAELEAMAKTLYDYWFVQFDFPFDFAQDKPAANGKPYKSSGGKMVYNPILKREIPEGWNVKKIGEVATVKAGGDKPHIFSVEKTETCSIPIYSNGINNDGLYGYTNQSTVASQSVTISARGTIGYSILRNKPFVPIIRLIVITPHVIGSANYFHEYLKTIEFEKSGSVQQQLTVPQVCNINILYPPIDVLKKFENLTSSGIEKIENIKEQNLTLIELRDWLLPMLMNGQVTVR